MYIVLAKFGYITNLVRFFSADLNGDNQKTIENKVFEIFVKITFI